MTFAQTPTAPLYCHYSTETESLLSQLYPKQVARLFDPIKKQSKNARHPQGQVWSQSGYKR